MALASAEQEEKVDLGGEQTTPGADAASQISGSDDTKNRSGEDSLGLLLLMSKAPVLGDSSAWEVRSSLPK